MPFFKRTIIPLLIFFFTFALYVHNASHSIYAGDAGDLVTAAFLGGVAHAPGYPFYTLLGFLLTRLPVSFSPAFMVGLISVFSGAFGAMFFYVLIYTLVKDKLISLLTTAILSTTYYYWFYSEFAEVFALNNLLIILLFLCVALLRKTKEKKYFFFIAGIFGLGFAHHQTIVFFVPSILLLITPLFFSLPGKLKILLQMTGSFLLGASFYLYIPFAASHHAAINWDNVHDISSFLHLVLRKDYGTFTAGSFNPPVFAQRIVILKNYLQSVMTQLTIPVCIISAIGVLELWRRKQRLLLLSFLLAFLISGPLFITYAGFPIYGTFFVGVYERFFIASSIIILFFFPYGMVWLSKLFGQIFSTRYAVVLLQLTFFIIPLLLYIYNFPKTSLENLTMGDMIGSDLLTPLPPHAILFLGGDTALFDTWYAHYALNIRPDVKVININGIGGDEYAHMVATYFKNNPQKRVKIPLQAIIADLSEKYSVFSVDQIASTDTIKMNWIPYGLSYHLLPSSQSELTKSSYDLLTQAIWKHMHIPYIAQRTKAGDNFSIAEIPTFYANALTSVGNYYANTYQASSEAVLWYNKALLVDPASMKAHQALSLYYLTGERNCQSAVDHLQAAIDANKFEKTSYFLLYVSYRDCLKNPQAAMAVATIYKNIFQEDINKSIVQALGGKGIK